MKRDDLIKQLRELPADAEIVTFQHYDEIMKDSYVDFCPTITEVVISGVPNRGHVNWFTDYSNSAYAANQSKKVWVIE